MNTHSFTEILKNPAKINSEHTTELQAIITAYPFFQAARAMYLKGLKNSDSFKYNAALKTTAAYTTDRTILFDFITSAIFTEPQKEIVEVHQQITRKITSDQPKDVKKELAIGKPFSFQKTETHSFNEWLQLAAKKKITRREPETPRPSKSEIIDTFIKTNPKISKVIKETEPSNVVVRDNQDSYLMTETLAKVYLEQKKYENAIKAYQILSLKYPEKSGFFADQIKRIRILQKNKS
ncbi:MAG: hypothetical protein HWD85_08630 [Flavobacteriaceae bacterium]|nr:hypothetical protein [Flavobacteriaceae bacterium]